MTTETGVTPTYVAITPDGAFTVSYLNPWYKPMCDGCKRLHQFEGRNSFSGKTKVAYCDLMEREEPCGFSASDEG